MDENDANQTPDRERTYDRMLVMMNVYSSILQGYRSIFVTVQAIFFAAAIYVVYYTQDLWVLAYLAIPSIVIALIWLFTCRRRGYDERFFHWQLLRMEDGAKNFPQNIVGALDEWRGTPRHEKVRRLVIDTFAWKDDFISAQREQWLDGVIFGGRWWMDIFLPIFSVVVWGVLAIVIALK